MKKKALERVERKTLEAKEMGLLTRSTKEKFAQQEKALGTLKKKRVREKGLVGSLGKIKGGVMTVSKHLIQKVNAPKSKSSGSSKSKRPRTF